MNNALCFFLGFIGVTVNNLFLLTFREVRKGRVIRSFGLNAETKKLLLRRDYVGKHDSQMEK